jgi:hypothetical protein
MRPLSTRAESYAFDEASGLIREVRAYYAAQARDNAALTLEGFDYQGRGYPAGPASDER